MGTAEPSEDLSAWFHFRNAGNGHESEIRACLSTARLRLVSREPAEDRDGIVCFDGFDEALAAILREFKQSCRGHILALRCSPVPLPSAHIWKLLQAGASEVLTWESPAILSARIRAKFARWHEIEKLAREALSETPLIGDSPVWRTLVRRIVEAARFSRAPILLLGESGTGKELLAHLVHAMDIAQAEKRRNSSELVTLDCSTIVPELSGSELFGHERGAFTGALNTREGAFALADGGTLFLDEIGELPLTLQLHLLRAVQEGTYKRVGGNTWQTTDFRLVCATNRDLIKLVKQGRFRLDLYHRIAGWVFGTPRLNDRREDIVPLARYFLKASGDTEGDLDFDPIVCEFLLKREYPGNVRELRQLVQRIRQRHAGPGSVTAGDIPEDDRPGDASASTWPDAQFENTISTAIALGTNLRQITQATTETAIRIAFQSEQGNLQRAAKRLGVTDRALQIRRAKRIQQ
jgi:transcriptional regulator with GAF, ATPase, and Fis domain